MKTKRSRIDYPRRFETLGKLRAARLACLMLLMLLVVLVGCEPASDNQTAGQSGGNKNGKPKIFAVSYPLQILTKELTGDFADVACPAASEEFPDQWRPAREILAEMQAADLIISNGKAAPYASWLRTSSLPASKTVEAASKGLSLADFISVEDIQIVHSHGPEGEHSHPTMVSRTWLSPKVFAKQAKYISKELSDRFPENATAFKNNLRDLETRIHVLSQKFAAVAGQPAATCLSVTPEMKFLTRFAGIDDRHFNWKVDTDVKRAADELEIRLKELTPKPNNAASETVAENPVKLGKTILFPSRLRKLADQLGPVLSDNNLTPLFVDLLDRKIEGIDIWSRMQTNLEISSEARRLAISETPE